MIDQISIEKKRKKKKEKKKRETVGKINVVLS